jgi:hypothetical protein
VDEFRSLSKIREAREALKARALELFERHLEVIDKAIDTGDLEVASKHLQFLGVRMPKDDDGTTFLDSSLDNKKQIEGPKGPQIQIGIALNGSQKSLPPKPKKLLPPSVQVIDVTED